MKTIEDSFENPLDKLTAQFMNMSGHRGEETSRLMIENFLEEKIIFFRFILDLLLNFKFYCINL